MKTKKSCKWRCENTGTNSTKKCPGKCQTLYSFINSQFSFFGPVTLNGSHNHMPLPERTDAVLALGQMLERAKITSERPRTIVKNCQLKVNKESANHLLRHSAVRQRIQRIRSKKVDYGPNSANIESIMIPEALKVSYDNEPFLHADSGFGDKNRIIIFSTPSNIALLKTNKIWYGDGTFAVAPEIFYQLYTLNIILNGKNLPMVYVLLADKSGITYDKMFSMLFESFTEKEFPKAVATDFEKAILNSIIKNSQM